MAREIKKDITRENKELEELGRFQDTYLKNMDKAEHIRLNEKDIKKAHKDITKEHMIEREKKDVY